MSAGAAPPVSTQPLNGNTKVDKKIINCSMPRLINRSLGKLTPPVLAPPLFWNILYHSRQLAHRHFNNVLLTHFFSNLLHLFNVLSPLIQDAVFRS